MAAAATDVNRPTYSAGAYWDSRYMGPAKNFDWFFNYPALKELLHQYLPSGRVLHVGCGNSNIQEGMAADGFTVTNVDISPVVIEQMKHQHADNQSLDYIVADCRDMHQLANGSFTSCIDKGTLDAVLCSQSGQVDAVKYLHEIARLLQPGGTFLLISLGAPAARISLLEKELWGEVQVLLLPKPLLYLQSDSVMTGRPLPSKCAANKDEPIQPLGPWPPARAAGELAQLQLDARDYFFAYICTKPVVGLQWKDDDDGRLRREEEEVEVGAGDRPRDGPQQAQQLGGQGQEQQTGPVQDQEPCPGPAPDHSPAPALGPAPDPSAAPASDLAAHPAAPAGGPRSPAPPAQGQDQEQGHDPDQAPGMSDLHIADGCKP